MSAVKRVLQYVKLHHIVLKQHVFFRNEPPNKINHITHNYTYLFLLLEDWRAGNAPFTREHNAGRGGMTYFNNETFDSLWSMTVLKICAASNINKYILHTIKFVKTNSYTLTTNKSKHT